MNDPSVLITAFLCATALILAALAYTFDWAKLKPEPSKDVAKRVDAYQDDVAAIRRSTGTGLDELERQLQRLTRTTETQSERFDTQLQRMIEERERYAALASEQGARVAGMRRP